jgi:hypothetical protein
VQAPSRGVAKGKAVGELFMTSGILDMAKQFFNHKTLQNELNCRTGGAESSPMRIFYYPKKLRTYYRTGAAGSSTMRTFFYLKRLYVQYRISPDAFKGYFNNIFSYCRGFKYAERWLSESYRSVQEQKVLNEADKESYNPLLDFFRKNKEGPGIWKWEHYFEVCQRHFSGFVNQPVNILGIGVYGGGSLIMWQSYF